MTRFEKYARALFPRVSFDENDIGEKGAYCIPEKALIVFCSAQLITVLRLERNGKQRDASNDFPEISAPYLVHLCNGDTARASEILRSTGIF